MADFTRESMMEMFNFEMSQLIQQLEQTLIEGESGYSMDQINEVFRIMHTIKGSAAMMNFKVITDCSHTIEDLFYYLREENPRDIDFSALTDHVFEGMDFIKVQLDKIQNDDSNFDDPTKIVEDIKVFLQDIKSARAAKAETGAAANEAKPEPPAYSGVPAVGMKAYRAKIKFEAGCEMENVRAYALLNNNKEHINDVVHSIPNIMDETSIEQIRRSGFEFEFTSNLSYVELRDLLNQTIYLQSLELEEMSGKDAGNKASSVYSVFLTFDEGSEMENVRAYTVVHNLKDKVESVKHTPADLIDEAGAEYIRNNGFRMEVVTPMSYNELSDILKETLYLKELVLEYKKSDGASASVSVQPAPPRTAPTAPAEPVAPVVPVAPVYEAPKPPPVQEPQNYDTGGMDMNTVSDIHNDFQTTEAPASDSSVATRSKSTAPAVISVNVNKLDQLFKFVGELVIAEAMVTQNPELENLELDGFHKEARQLRKIIKDLQDTVMSMRMVPLSTTFFKMNRIVRDMCKSLNKEVQLDILGDSTEVDKNIIEHINDPLMHIIRNAIDHGIESPIERAAKGKSERGTILLEAKNSGSDILITVKDDGAGLNKEKIMAKAKNNGLLRKPENEYTDKEIFQFINMPGFSTNDNITSYSGRGVGMDVVTRNLEPIGGTILVDSSAGEGSTFTLKIPLTLAIVEGMLIKLGGAKYTIPIVAIKNSFKPQLDDIFVDPNGNEMITVRDQCYNIVRLHEFFGIADAVSDFEKGTMMIVENGSENVCLFLDDLIGEQQVVVKSMPKYIKKINGISGCTLLGNGDISLIIDVAGFFDK